MSEKEYAQGIYVKKFTNQYGDWISVAIKDGDSYKNYKFYPRKEQKSDKYVEFYGVKDDWKPTKTSSKSKDEVINEDEIPF
jgi:hypothetical protein